MKIPASNIMNFNQIIASSAKCASDPLEIVDRAPGEGKFSCARTKNLKSVFPLAHDQNSLGPRAITQHPSPSFYQRKLLKGW